MECPNCRLEMNWTPGVRWWCFRCGHEYLPTMKEHEKDAEVTPLPPDQEMRQLSPDVAPRLFEIYEEMPQCYNSEQETCQ